MSWGAGDIGFGGVGHSARLSGVFVDKPCPNNNSRGRVNAHSVVAMRKPAAERRTQTLTAHVVTVITRENLNALGLSTLRKEHEDD